MVDMLVTLHVGIAFAVYLVTMMVCFAGGILIGREMKQ